MILPCGAQRSGEGGPRLRGGGGDRALNTNQHVCQSPVIQNIGSRNTQHLNTLLSQPSIAILIVPRLLSRSVNLDCKPGMRAKEIENIRPYRMLPTEAQPCKPPTP